MDMNILSHYRRLIAALMQLLVVGALLLSTMSCFDFSRGKVPITTSSEQAREYFRLGRDLAERLRRYEAGQYYKKAIACDSNFALAYAYIVETEPMSSNQVLFLNKAVSLVGGVSDGERLLILATQAFYENDRTRARDYYKQLARLYPNDERVHDLLGTSYYGTREYEDAVREYRVAIKINSRFSPPYNGLGYAYRYLGDYVAAEEAFLKYIQLIPHDPNPHDSYAELMMHMGRFRDGVVHYQKALEINPYFLNAYTGLASCYNYMGQHEEARAQLDILHDRARTVSQHRDTHYARAVSFSDEGKLDSALNHMRISLELAQRVHDTAAMADDLNNSGEILLEMGMKSLALEKYQQALKIIETSSLAQGIKDDAQLTYLHHATIVAIRLGDLTRAQSYVEKYRAEMKTASDLMQLRLFHETSGALALAENDYETAINEIGQADLRDAYNLYRLAQAYHGAGRHREAAETYEKVANYYADNSLRYAFVRNKANEFLAAVTP